MADDVTLTIDGQEITVPRGTTILKAAEALGIEIPVFCYHDGLPIAANCRMCLVESSKHKTPIPACQVEVMPEMEVSTTSEVVKKARRGVLELILLNHPVDCPICDQVGECKLQDHFYEHDLMPSRQVFRKVHKPKAVRIGPHVVFDGERCILCTRCVRFCEDVIGSPQLTTINRGDHTEITTFPGEELDNPYSLCTVDLCPVGALTSADFRFKSRVYFLEDVDTHCTHCARGCAITVQKRDGRILRVVPRKDMKINRWWACDEGRLAFHAYEEERVVLYRKFDGSAATKASPDEVMAELEEQLAAKASSLAFVITPNLLNEDCQALFRLVRETYPEAAVYLGSTEPGFEDDFLIRADKHPNRAGVELLARAHEVELETLDGLPRAIEEGTVEAVVVIDGAFARPSEIMEAFEKLSFLAYMGSNQHGLAGKAHLVVPIRTPYERSGTFITFEGILVKVTKAIDAPEGVTPTWMVLGELGSHGHRTPSEVFASMAEVVAPLSGMSLKELDPLGVELEGLTRT